jgi:hypothetical protein
MLIAAGARLPDHVGGGEAVQEALREMGVATASERRKTAARSLVKR